MVGVVEKVVGGWRCGEVGWWLVVGVVEKVVGGWSKITIVKEKRLTQRSQPG